MISAALFRWWEKKAGSRDVLMSLNQHCLYAHQGRTLLSTALFTYRLTKALLNSLSEKNPTQCLDTGVPIRRSPGVDIP